MRKYIKLIAKESTGFTLIELLLVVGLLAISVGVTSDILLSLIRSYSKSQVINTIEQNANFVSLKLEKELRNAVSVDKIGSTTNPTAGTTGNAIYFTNRNEEIITYDLNSANRFRRGVCTSLTSCTYTFLSPGTTSIGTIEVLCPNNCFRLAAQDPDVININIQFQQAGTSSSKIFTGNVVIDNTIVIRNSY